MTPSRSRRARSSVGVGGDAVVVRDEQDRHPVLPPELIEQLEHLRAGDGVECAGRLVGEEQPRLVRERARDRHPLALAARQHRRPGSPRPRSPTSLEQLAGARRRSRRGRCPNIGSCDVLGGGQRREQVVGLEDEADRRRPVRGEGLGGPRER